MKELPIGRGGASRNPPRFLIIGCGSIGKRHMGNLLTLDVRDILAFDTQPERLREVKSKLGVRVVDDLEDAWKQDPDVAVISAPTSKHIELATLAARHGCHLFIEKPLSHSLSGVDRLLDIIDEQRLVTMVGCNMRFHPGLTMTKKLIDVGAVGPVVGISAEFGQYLPDWHPREDYRQGYSASSRLGGGVILDAIHEIDYVRWLVGDVQSVACFAGKLSHLDIDTEDTAALLLLFVNGAIGEIHMDYVQRAYSRTCRVVGEEGTIRWDQVAGEVRLYSTARRKWKTFLSPRNWQLNQMYLDELNHFLTCLAADNRTMLDVHEAKRVLEIAIAAKSSAASGRVIKMV